MEDTPTHAPAKVGWNLDPAQPPGLSVLCKPRGPPLQSQPSTECGCWAVVR